MKKYLICGDCGGVIRDGNDYWELPENTKLLLCEDCFDDYLEEMKNDNRKTNEQDIDNEVEEMMLERGE